MRARNKMLLSAVMMTMLSSTVASLARGRQQALVLMAMCLQ